MEGVVLLFFSPEEAPRRGVYAPQDLYTFPATRVGESSSLKVNMRNNSFDTHEVRTDLMDWRGEKILCPVFSFRNTLHRSGSLMDGYGVNVKQ